MVPGNARFVTDNEVVLGNYWFPKKVGELPTRRHYCWLRPQCVSALFNVCFVKTLFHLCHYTVLHDEAQFEAAESFMPHRWLRPERPMLGFYRHHPYSFIPFGVGVRGCVGKRLAEMELHFALARVSPPESSPTFWPLLGLIMGLFAADSALRSTAYWRSGSGGAQNANSAHPWPTNRLTLSAQAVKKKPLLA